MKQRATRLRSILTTSARPQKHTYISRPFATLYKTTITHSNLRLSTLLRQFPDPSQQRKSSTMSNQHGSGTSTHVKAENLLDVSGRVCLVTGGGSGIGLMATQALSRHGAKVYIVGRTEEKLQEVAERYGKNTPGQIIPLAYDVSKKDQIEALYKDFSSREKCCCVLINNAGIMGGTYQTEASSAEEMKKNLFDNGDATVDEWTSLYKTLVAQIYFMTTAFLPLLAHSTNSHPGYSGTVINIASISGMVKIFQHHPAYNTAKAAAIHLGRMLASEIANNNLKIRVNTISPGVFPSEMTAGDSDDAQKSHIEKQKYEGKVPAARPGKDEDMASAILFCVANQYLNGQNIVVDGGYTLAAGL